eukprot:1160015-Pleurochrysis_carterae.AAC.2
MLRMPFATAERQALAERRAGEKAGTRSQGSATRGTAPQQMSEARRRVYCLLALRCCGQAQHPPAACQPRKHARRCFIKLVSQLARRLSCASVCVLPSRIWSNVHPPAAADRSQSVATANRLEVQAVFPATKCISYDLHILFDCRRPVIFDQRQYAVVFVLATWCRSSIDASTPWMCRLDAHMVSRSDFERASLPLPTVRGESRVFFEY